MVRSPFESVPERPISRPRFDTFGRGFGQADLDWQEQAACRDADPELFFHPEGERSAMRRRRAEAAKVYCGRCAVLEVCREQSLASREPYGVWGGISEDERHAIFAGRLTRP